MLTIFTCVPYVKGAFFLCVVERKIGRAMFDATMRQFYDAHDGEAAGVADLVDAVRATSGYDAAACAQAWLAQRAIPTDLTCP